jgi:CubicO group peptidase (beta-lactamase class C family)
MKNKGEGEMNTPLITRRCLSASLTIVLAAVALLSLAGSAMAQGDRNALGKNLPVASSQQQGPTDPAELEAFLDDLLGKEMAEQHIAGAAVAVVKDSKLFFSKGYGSADLEKGIPVDPEQTGFLIGSVTKLFTWTAVMQLVEQGKLDLDADINTYLDFRIPDTYPQPITLKHLLTHTAGFEDLFVNYLASEGEELTPWREWMISHMPARVRPPGDVAAYSNYGTSLAGYIVARVSGQPYDQYIQEHILDPLGMVHTTAHWPLPPDVRAHESVGYMYKDGAIKVFPQLFGQWMILPVGGMVASATDMARFMIAHLQDGRYSDANIPEARILKEATAQQMQGTLFTHDPRLLGTAYGFFDFSDNGQRTIGHSGETEPMNTLLLLLPDQNLGVFVTYNSLGGEALTNQHLGFQRAFFDHYYPAPAVEPIQPPAGSAQRAGRFEGSYRTTRSAYTTLEKFIGFFGAGTLQVSPSGDGTLTLATPWGDWRFVEVAPLYFRQVDAPFSIVFREDGRGHITHMFTDYTPMFGFEKLNWYETPGFNVALLVGCVLIFLSMIFVAAIRSVRNRRTSGDRKPAPRGARVAHWIILGICVLNLLFVAGAALWGNPKPVYGVSTIFQIVLGLGVVSAALTVAALVYTVLAWMGSYWGVAFRAYYTLVTLAAVAFVWFLNYWNLLGWRF